MGLKKVLDNGTPIKGYSNNFIVIDRIWWNPKDKSLLGDINWSFCEMDNTKTFDFSYAKSLATNFVIYDREDAEDGLEPIYPVYFVIERGEENKTLSVVTSLKETDTEFISYIQNHYPEVELIHVSEEQQYIPLGHDESMEVYNRKSLDISTSLLSLVSDLNSYHDDVKLVFKPIMVENYEITGISKHQGMDGLYYNLLSKNNVFPGMQYYRLDEFFTHLAPSQQDAVLEGLLTAKTSAKVVKEKNKACQRGL